MKKKPTCFISYSYDSRKHVKWVNRLASRLRSHGVEVKLDSLDNELGDDLVQYMIKSIESDKVVMVCTPKYCEKITGGAAFEKMLAAGELAKDALSKKFIPILQEGRENEAIPKFLHTKVYIQMNGKNIREEHVEKIVKAVFHKQRNKTKSKKAKIHVRTTATEISLSDVSDISRIKLIGYSLLGGRGADGIRYLWKTHDNSYTESAAFNVRLNNKYKISKEDRSISAYTTSVCFGCQLQNMNKSCSFCATGLLRFKGNLTAEEIALQNIFMAEYDSDCPSWPEVHRNSREFAFMGQGEPGLCYPQVRRAILLTDAAMEKIGQKVHRYLISTVGISDMLDLFIEDLRHKIFKNLVTIHFSLHAVGKERNIIMPINSMYPYERFLSRAKSVTDITGEKIAVGILLFKDFLPTHSRQDSFTTTEKYLDSMLNILDPKYHRVDLCDVNMNSAIQQHEVSNEQARVLLARTKSKGFEVKLFSSFGADKNAGCGMLKSIRTKIEEPCTTTVKHFNESVKLLRDVLNVESKL